MSPRMRLGKVNSRRINCLPAPYLTPPKELRFLPACQQIPDILSPSSITVWRSCKIRSTGYSHIKENLGTELTVREMRLSIWANAQAELGSGSLNGMRGGGVFFGVIDEAGKDAVESDHLVAIKQVTVHRCPRDDELRAEG